MHITSVIPVLLAISCMLLSSCNDQSKPVNLVSEMAEEQEQIYSFPFDVSKDSSVAYISRDYLEIHLVAASDVMLIRLKLPEDKIPVLETRISEADSDQKIVHHRGREVSKFVLPMGAAQPFTDNPDYSRSTAISAVVECRNPPQAGRFEYGKEVTLFVKDLEFGDGKHYHLGPVSLIVGAYPP